MKEDEKSDMEEYSSDFADEDMHAEKFSSDFAVDADAGGFSSRFVKSWTEWGLPSPASRWSRRLVIYID